MRLIPTELSDWPREDPRGSSDQPGSSGGHRPSRQHIHAERDATEIRDDRGRLLRLEVTPNVELRHANLMEKGPAEDAPVSTRDGALQWMEEEIRSGLRKDERGPMENLESSMDCIMRAKAKWPEVPTKRY